MPHDRPLSRRALMKSAAVVSIMAAGKKAWADLSDENLADIYKLLAPIPTTEWGEIETEVKNRNPGIDLARYKLVCTNLWTYLQMGAAPFEIDSAVALHAYSYGGKADGLGTGELLAERLAEFDIYGQHRYTNVCAYQCGFEALKCAVREGESTVQVRHYELGWDVVSLTMKRKLDKVAGNSFRAAFGFGC